LLKRTATEIAGYSEAQGIAAMRAAAISDDDVPFEAPAGWRWRRLCALFLRSECV
jgi:hypothetical protein